MITQSWSDAGVFHPEGLVRRHPLAAALALYVAFELVHAAFAWNGGRLLDQVAGEVPGTWRGPLVWSVYAGLALLPVAVLGWWRQTGLTRPGRIDAWPLVLLPLAAGLPFLAVGFHLSSDAIVPVLIVGTPLIALNEELFFRGLLLEMLRPLGWKRAITTTAVLFGAAHLLNLPAGASVPFTVLQVAATTAGGVTLAAIRIRAGSLWPVVVLHVLLDAMALATLTGAGVDSPLVVPVVLAWGALNALLWPIGWRLLRGRTDPELTSLYAGA
jgi:hypothetical protein